VPDDTEDRTLVEEELSHVEKQVRSFDELGSTGLKRSGMRGSVYEEFLPQLSGERWRKVYREMADNDPVVGAIRYAIEMLLRNVTLRRSSAC
jgi:hypothetical protein